MKKNISQARLKELLHYEPDTGEFTWRKNVTSRVRAGDKAGRNHQTGYVQIGIGGDVYMSHRLAWLYTQGEFPEDQIDHINHQRNDNRRANLRTATPGDNSRNQGIRKTNKSGVMGVVWVADRSRWAANIRVEGKQKQIGRYKCLLDAVAARLRANKEYGYHENHGATSA